MYVKPNDLRFNEEYDQNEDYEYYLQHMKKFGGIIQNCDIHAHYRHWGNSGGAVSSRSNYLADKLKNLFEKDWGSYIKAVDNNKNNGNFKMNMRYANIKKDFISKDSDIKSLSLSISDEEFDNFIRELSNNIINDEDCLSISEFIGNLAKS